MATLTASTGPLDLTTPVPRPVKKQSYLNIAPLDLTKDTSGATSWIKEPANGRSSSSYPCAESEQRYKDIVKGSQRCTPLRSTQQNGSVNCSHAPPLRNHIDRQLKTEGLFKRHENDATNDVSSRGVTVAKRTLGQSVSSTVRCSDEHVSAKTPTDYTGEEQELSQETPKSLSPSTARPVPALLRRSPNGQQRSRSLEQAPDDQQESNDRCSSAPASHSVQATTSQVGLRERSFDSQGSKETDQDSGMDCCEDQRIGEPVRPSPFTEAAGPQGGFYGLACKLADQLKALQKADIGSEIVTPKELERLRIMGSLVESENEFVSSLAKLIFDIGTNVQSRAVCMKRGYSCASFPDQHHQCCGLTHQPTEFADFAGMERADRGLARPPSIHRSTQGTDLPTGVPLGSEMADKSVSRKRNSPNCEADVVQTLPKIRKHDAVVSSEVAVKPPAVKGKDEVESEDEVSVDSETAESSEESFCSKDAGSESPVLSDNVSSPSGSTQETGSEPLAIAKVSSLGSDKQSTRPKRSLLEHQTPDAIQNGSMTSRSTFSFSDGESDFGGAVASPAPHTVEPMNEIGRCDTDRILEMPRVANSPSISFLDVEETSKISRKATKDVDSYVSCNKQYLKKSNDGVQNESQGQSSPSNTTALDSYCEQFRTEEKAARQTVDNPEGPLENDNRRLDSAIALLQLATSVEDETTRPDQQEKPCNTQETDKNEQTADTRVPCENTTGDTTSTSQEKLENVSANKHRRDTLPSENQSDSLPSKDHSNASEKAKLQSREGMSSGAPNAAADCATETAVKEPSTTISTSRNTQPCDDKNSAKCTAADGDEVNSELRTEKPKQKSELQQDVEEEQITNVLSLKISAVQGSVSTTSEFQQESTSDDSSLSAINTHVASCLESMTGTTVSSAVTRTETSSLVKEVENEQTEPDMKSENEKLKEKFTNQVSISSTLETSDLSMPNLVCVNQELDQDAPKTNGDHDLVPPVITVQRYVSKDEHGNYDSEDCSILCKKKYKTFVDAFTSLNEDKVERREKLSLQHVSKNFNCKDVSVQLHRLNTSRLRRYKRFIKIPRYVFEYVQGKTQKVPKDVQVPVNCGRHGESVKSDPGVRWASKTSALAASCHAAVVGKKPANVATAKRSSSLAAVCHAAVIEEAKRQKKPEDSVDQAKITDTATVEEASSTRPKKHVCILCNKVSSTEEIIELHAIKHHINLKPFGCPLCEQKSATYRHMEAHILEVHKDVTCIVATNPRLRRVQKQVAQNCYAKSSVWRWSMKHVVKRLGRYEHHLKKALGTYLSDQQKKRPKEQTVSKLPPKNRIAGRRVSEGNEKRSPTARKRSVGSIKKGSTETTAKSKGSVSSSDLRQSDEERPKDTNKTIETKAPEDPFECILCGFKAYYEATMMQHTLQHLHLLPYCCSACPKKFKTRRLAQEHVKTSHSKTPGAHLEENTPTRERQEVLMRTISVTPSISDNERAAKRRNLSRVPEVSVYTDTESSEVVTIAVPQSMKKTFTTRLHSDRMVQTADARTHSSSASTKDKRVETSVQKQPLTPRNSSERLTVE